MLLFQDLFLLGFPAAPFPPHLRIAWLVWRPACQIYAEWNGHLPASSVRVRWNCGTQSGHWHKVLSSTLNNNISSNMRLFNSLWPKAITGAVACSKHVTWIMITYPLRHPSVKTTMVIWGRGFCLCFMAVATNRSCVIFWLPSSFCVCYTRWEMPNEGLRDV